jgi:hypothetical protein
MKKLHILAIFIFSSILVFCSEEAIVFTTYQDYSQQDLIKARYAWTGQENRIGQLAYQALNIESNNIVIYKQGSHHVATINAHDTTITTNIGDNKQVKLSYEDFTRLLKEIKIN